MSKIVKASTYIVLVPEISGSGSYRYVRNLRADRIRASKPSLRSGEIVFKLNLQFNEQQLIDNIPEITLDVTNYAIGAPSPVAVEVENDSMAMVGEIN